MSAVGYVAAGLVIGALIGGSIVLAGFFHDIVPWEARVPIVLALLCALAAYGLHWLERDGAASREDGSP